MHYKVGVSPEGKFIVFDNKILTDCGCAHDYSDYIADEMMKRQDGAYHIPNYRVNVTLLKTSNPSTTPVRAPGLYQANVVSETIVVSVTWDGF